MSFPTTTITVVVVIKAILKIDRSDRKLVSYAGAKLFSRSHKGGFNLTVPRENFSRIQYFGKNGFVYAGRIALENDIFEAV